MALLKGITTIQHMVTKKYSRPDNFFCTETLLSCITRCEVDLTLQPTSTNHFPIITKILISQKQAKDPLSFNFRTIEWEIFRRKLTNKFKTLPDPVTINDTEQLDEAIYQLTTTKKPSKKMSRKQNQDQM